MFQADWRDCNVALVFVLKGLRHVQNDNQEKERSVEVRKEREKEGWKERS